MFVVKTEIELPDNLYRRAKAAAAERPCSLAELVRKSLENVLGKPASKPPKQEKWEPPKPRDLGWANVHADELKRLAQED